MTRRSLLRGFLALPAAVRFAPVAPPVVHRFTLGQSYSLVFSGASPAPRVFVIRAGQQARLLSWSPWVHRGV